MLFPEFMYLAEADGYPENPTPLDAARHHADVPVEAHGGRHWHYVAGTPLVLVRLKPCHRCLQLAYGLTVTDSDRWMQALGLTPETESAG